MSFEAALSLPILELLQVLRKKLTLEYTRVREIRLPPGVASVSVLEAEIEHLKVGVNQVLGFIPSLVNLLQPVNRLPPEIFSRIARHIPDVDARDTRSIVPITHVCQYWRKSITLTPENWTLICNDSFGLTGLSLERCKAAPLKLHLDMRKAKWYRGFSDLITPHIQNAETLHLDQIPMMEEFALILENFPQAMPYLRSLSLNGPRGSDWDWPADPCEPLASPLTHLSLVEIPLYRSFLRLGTLKVLNLRHYRFDRHLDTLLDFLENNRSLERATLDIRFTFPSLRNSQRQVPIENQLQYLSVSAGDSRDSNALISKIAVQRGAHLEIILRDRNAGLNDIRSVVSTTHLSNLHSPTFLEYWPDKRSIRLLGPSGSFSFERSPATEGPFVEFPLLPLNNIRAFNLIRPAWEESRFKTLTFPPLSLPALETFSIEYEINPTGLLSRLFSNPSSYPSLKTLAFLDCDIDGTFMGQLIRFSCNRRNTTSAWLYRVVIVNSKGNLPDIPSIDMLRGCVPVVDVRVGKELPSDLK